MRKTKLISLIIILIGNGYGQDNYYSVYDVQEEWKNYTRFQKQEIVSFANFLYSEKFYDRALLSFFQYLYRFPGDSLELVVYYHVARCYEESGNTGLANIYYQRVLEASDSTNLAYQAARYRLLYLLFLNDEMEVVLEQTELAEDPYLLVMRGYAFFHKMDWKASRQVLLAAEEQFNHEYYSELLAPIFQALDNVIEVPLKKKWLSFATAMVPGGGRAYLNQWNAAAGTMLSTSILLAIGTNTFSVISGKISYQEHINDFIPVANALVSQNGADFRSRGKTVPLGIRISRPDYKLIVPPLALGIGIYIGSIWKTVADIENANLKLVKTHVSTAIEENPLTLFFDFPEPEFFIK